uniref:Yellow2 n=1 Tax=Bombyx mori TaxID=7091 RepID=A4GR70_BOMMO|nr:yellow2 [Bombyx mori]
MKVFLLFLLLAVTASGQLMSRKVGKLTEVFAWKQLTYNIQGNLFLEDRFATDTDRRRRQTDSGFRQDNRNQLSNRGDLPLRPSWNLFRPEIVRPFVKPVENETGRFFVQYNNVPMGVEKVGDRLFITVPRRRYGVPSTLNYVDLTTDSNTRSPALRPYPSLREGSSLVSVYRTRADECGRLWMVDTGRLEIPDNHQQVQPPAIVVFDLNTDRELFRYQFKSSDIPAENTPTGLASITIDTKSGCDTAHAYVPDLTTYGIIVYSLRDNDSWRISHSYFHFNPIAGNLNIAGQSFQWSDGIFSLTIKKTEDRCDTAYFHPLISTHEFAVSTCLLNNRTASSDSDYWTRYSIVGERGPNSQSTMHAHDAETNVMFYAEVGRDAFSCWNTAKPLTPSNVEILAKDAIRSSYPSDLHITDGEVWLMANSLPRFGYARLDTNEYNFFIYRANIRDAIYGTTCSGR